MGNFGDISHRTTVTVVDWDVLDVLVLSRRNGNAAKRFFRKILKRLQYVPRVIVTDKLGSYQVVHREILVSVEHRQSSI